MPESAPEADAHDVSACGVADGKDGIEDSGKVDGVDWRCEAGGNDAGRRRTGHALGGLLGERAALDAVKLQIAPKDPGDEEEAPSEELLEGLWEKGDVGGAEEKGRVEHEDKEPWYEEGKVKELGRRRGRRRVRNEGRDAGA